MTADALREAAALMRERAEAVELPDGDDMVLPYAEAFFGVEGPDAAHAASWHPAVALAVADWLEQMAVSWHLYENHAIRNTAIVTARTYLGGAR